MWGSIFKGKETHLEKNVAMWAYLLVRKSTQFEKKSRFTLDMFLLLSGAVPRGYAYKGFRFLNYSIHESVRAGIKHCGLTQLIKGFPSLLRLTPVYKQDASNCRITHIPRVLSGSGGIKVTSDACLVTGLSNTSGCSRGD